LVVSDSPLQLLDLPNLLQATFLLSNLQVASLVNRAQIAQLTLLNPLLADLHPVSLNRPFSIH
jgi:hypothetical protein